MLDIANCLVTTKKSSCPSVFTNHLKNKRIPSKVDLLKLTTLQFEVAVLYSPSRKYD